MHRFYIVPPDPDSSLVDLPREQADQARRVLRLAPGSRIVLFWGDGAEWEAEIVECNSRRVSARLLTRATPARELAGELTVAAALLKGDRPEWLAQKLTELGVHRILFWQAARSISRPDAARWRERERRLNRVAAEACEQCGRLRPPQIAGISDAAGLTNIDTEWLLADPEGPPALPVAPEGRLGVVVGPEGGLTAEEMEMFRGRGFRPWRLGSRVLRAETACLAAAAVLAREIEIRTPAGG